MNKIEIVNILNKYNFDKNRYMVISGASMVLQGIKEETKDIDIAVTIDYRKELLNKYKCEFERKNLDCDVYFIDEIIKFSKNYFNQDEIIMYENIPIQNLDGIKKLKLSIGRDKDLKDIAKISSYLDLNSLALAYIGDAVYELYIRKYLVNKKILKVKDLQKESIKYVSAPYQAKFLKQMIEEKMLTDEEMEIVKRARNHKSRSSKNTDIVTYKYSTAFEALIGYLEINYNKKRIEEIMNYIYNFKEVN